MRFHKISQFMVACLLFCCISLTAHASDTGKPFQTITVVSDDNYPPYIFRNANGDIQGIIVDEWALWEKKNRHKGKLNCHGLGQSKRIHAQREGRCN